MFKSSRLPISLVVLAILAPSLALGTSLLAQQADRPIRLDANLVTVDATVLDKNGNYVRNLKAEHFRILDDGRPQQLDFFEAGEQAALTRPLAVIFALDLSGSIKPEELNRQREAAESFIRLVRPESLFAVITFNYEVRVLQEFTSDPNKISQAFRKIRDATGSTRLFASIDKGVAMLKRAPQYRQGRRLRRVILVISDGIHTESMEQSDLIRRAQEAEVTVYSITLPSYLYGGAHKQRVITLLDASRVVPLTGGKDFTADASDFTPAFKAIAEEIRASYSLAYYPPEEHLRDGREHQISVLVNHPGAIVRASRQSYKSNKK
jgi:Ca-activated chloride channel family protein